VNRKRRFLPALILSAGAIALLALASFQVFRDGAHSAHGAEAAAPASTPHRATIALKTWLRHQYLNYRWVTCVPAHRTYQSHPLSRCNVNFGSPHIVPYCVALTAKGLLTDHQRPAIDCGGRVRYDEHDLSVYVRSRP
jgi:hypothetical protein